MIVTAVGVVVVGDSKHNFDQLFNQFAKIDIFMEWKNCNFKKTIFMDFEYVFVSYCAW